MIPIVCVDDSWGMAFGGRRQSRDREVSARVLADAAGRPLWCAPSSLTLFGPGAEGHLTAAEDFLNRRARGVLLRGGRPLLPWLERMEGLVLYRWNRRYPADVYLDIRPEPPGWRLVSREEFSGSSHPRITKEVYQR